MKELAETDDGATALSAKQLAHFEKRLLDERKLAVREVGRLDESLGASATEADGDLTNYPFHMADQGTDTIEQEKNFLLASQTGRLLLHIDEALRRLYRSPETFGRCESCGQVIAYERLDALPYARTCAACKKREENATPAVADGPATT
jgi:RNA polymerase-binding transcription factor DksA